MLSGVYITGSEGDCPGEALLFFRGEGEISLVKAMGSVRLDDLTIPDDVHPNVLK